MYISMSNRYQSQSYLYNEDNAFISNENVDLLELIIFLFTFRWGFSKEKQKGASSWPPKKFRYAYNSRINSLYSTAKN